MEDNEVQETIVTPHHERQAVLNKFQLDAVDSLIMDATFDFPGITQAEIGKLVNLTPVAVCRRMHTERYLKALAERTEPPKKILEKAANRLTRHYLKLCEFSEPAVSERATSKVLNSLGIIQQTAQVQVDQKVLVQDVIKRPGDRGETQLNVQILPKEDEPK